eukprot:Protomagalhaensia_wolfi_Nauph_80__149@NODE_1084_length_1749_cov_37_083041_g826_i0_p1_GENE_NODE_1084_length_1749_cov_37_083041_g826_i0NODE_1084_length_1749_cov_37_083041_g826_i0_p1_ORF_typecomplete_len188_score16_14DUF2019/PF09450_10/0_15_NODE_1084_length_1749_cov_37_083041_g826_i010041567
MYPYIRHMDFIKIRRVMKTRLSEDLTVLARLLQLLDHPSWNVKLMLTHFLHELVFKDTLQEFSEIVSEQVSHSGRHWLGYSMITDLNMDTIFGFFEILAYQYNFVHHAITSGMVEDILLILAATKYSSHFTGDTFRMLSFLEALITRCNQDQRQTVTDMGLFEVIRNCVELTQGEKLYVYRILQLSS